MSVSSPNTFTRRAFLRKAAVLTATVPLVPGIMSSRASAGFGAGRATYRCLDREEAVFSETLVNALCPADELTLDGVACGLVRSIDRKLAGKFGAEASQLEGRPTHRQAFRAGVVRVNSAANHRFGVRFDQLNLRVAREFLRDVELGRAGRGLASWYRWNLDPLLVRASLYAPIHDGFSHRVFWKLYYLS